MPGLFSNPAPSDDSLLEGIVTGVDAIRFVCQVKTVHGQPMTGVTWLLPTGGSGRSGNHILPKLNDRVVISTGLGYPIIIGFLPSPTDRETFPVPIDNNNKTLDTGNYLYSYEVNATNAEKPQDLHIGDHVTTSEGGGLVGTLRGGSFLAKASRLAQIFVTKYDDLVRIVGRNFEVFSDCCMDVTASVRGAVYRYIGYGTGLSDARQDTYTYEEFYGNTAASEALKGAYVQATSDAVPVHNGIVRKYHAGAMTETLADGGELIRTTSGIIMKHNTSMYQITADGSSIVTVTGPSIVITQTGGSTVTVDASQIKAERSGGSSVTITDSSIVATKGASTATIQDANTTIVNGSSTMTVASDSITAVNGGATLTVKDGQSSLMVGGHGVQVSSGGVSFV